MHDWSFCDGYDGYDCPVPDVGRAATERGCYGFADTVVVVALAGRRSDRLGCPHPRKGSYSPWKVRISIAEAYVHRIKMFDAVLCSANGDENVPSESFMNKKNRKFCFVQ